MLSLKHIKILTISCAYFQCAIKEKQTVVWHCFFLFVSQSLATSTVFMSKTVPVAESPEKLPPPSPPLDTQSCTKTFAHTPSRNPTPTLTLASRTLTWTLAGLTSAGSCRSCLFLWVFWLHETARQQDSTARWHQSLQRATTTGQGQDKIKIRQKQDKTKPNNSKARQWQDKTRQGRDKTRQGQDQCQPST